MDPDPKKRLMRELVLQQDPPPRCVLFVDLLGFGNLTEQYPNPVVWNFDSEDVSAETSDSAIQLGRFQYVLNTVPYDRQDTGRHSHLMLFSDCAFLVYDNPLQAALSSTDLMRRFLTAAVPVRMGLAYGTWHVRRFSFDSVDDVTITRAVFYGTGVVRATKAEKNGGKGCRIFVHSNLDGTNLTQIKQKVQILEIPNPNPAAPFELNYLFPEELDEMANDQDLRLLKGLKTLYERLISPVRDEVERQYTDTFGALNRMREQWGRPQLVARFRNADE